MNAELHGGLCDNAPVKILSYVSHHRAPWLKSPVGAQKNKPWLLHSASLTARLQAAYPDFHVRPVRNAYHKPLSDEGCVFPLGKSRQCLIRDVLLMGQTKPRVFAHSVIPQYSMRTQWHKLAKLGNQPLGAILFKNPRVVRAPFQYKKLTRNHPLFRMAEHYCTEKPVYMWARRSVFRLNYAMILVTEVFLPSIHHD